MKRRVSETFLDVALAAGCVAIALTLVHLALFPPDLPPLPAWAERWLP